MSVPHQPATDTAATAEVTTGAVLSPATDTGGPTDLPETDETGDDASLEPADEVAPAGSRGTGTELLVREGDVAGDYLERLLDILDVDGDIDLDVEGDRASVAIVGGELDDLVGSDGSVLEALQELTRLAVAQSTGVRSRLMLDIGGYRARRRADLTSLAAEAARRVAASRQPERLAPMNPFERKVVHDVVAGVAGVRSESEGEEPGRRVVVLPER
ncbi:spoIIIJ-associated protein [Geodermatophilus obscurus]|uniref:SpoIIIJ-associated protein n=1 Tax=Geodermatophilus obscurus TaxID=1861 RepID=A0A1I5G688_9ACTN|nr:R3H domain-containing nucleic acid-binding protein [Geodermatophilus obscurus]SFO31051.1 spoIIIJ-associated protein [Geodermatophilus obscurus]